MNRNPTATLWLFAYGGITTRTHVSVLRECLSWPNLQHKVMDEESLISRARSRVASDFLKDDRQTAGDVLLMVDRDISWQAGDLSLIARRALERNAVVGGIYPMRVFGKGASIRFNDCGEFKTNKDQLINCDFVSSGFMAIPRMVLEVLEPTLPFIKEGYRPYFLPMVVTTEKNGETGDEYLSEDWAFCHRARNAGFKVLASTYPKLNHKGDYDYRLIDSRYMPPPEQDITIKLEESLSSAAYAAKET